MGNESSNHKKAFEFLDKDHSGHLTLEEILSVPQLPGLEYVYNSLWLLFKFDKHKQGTITYHEFEKLLNYIKSIIKKDKKFTKSKSKLWIPITRKTAKREYHLSRDSCTPVITGQIPSDDESTTDEADSDNEELSEHIYIETTEFFEKTIASEEGRQTFYNWLFKLTDYDRQGIITAPKLSILIRALRQDGINPVDLTYDAELKLKLNEDLQDLAIAKQLIVEYSANNLDFITEKEFETLARIILKNYELHYDEINDRVGGSITKITGYTLKNKIGTGSAGIVRLAVDHKTGQRKAIKIVPKRDISDLSRLDTEIKAMMMLNHERILNLEQVIESESEVFFVMEYCGGGTLYDYMDGNPLPESLVRYYFSEIVQGVSYCHSKGIAHRDLKLDNILLDNTGHLKIADFGHAGIYKKGWDIFSTPLVGSLCHVAPEQILGKAYSGEKHDIWSLGIILYTLLVGKHPFKEDNPEAFLEKVKNASYKTPSFLSPEAKDLIKSLLDPDLNKRPTCKAILKHEWLRNGQLNAPILSSFTFPVKKGVFKRISTLEGLCKELEKMGIEPIYTEDSLQACEEGCRFIRCHWIEKDLKFHFYLKNETEDKDFFEFRLKSGASLDFLSLMPKLSNRIMKRMWRNSKMKFNYHEFREIPTPEIVPVVRECK